MAAAATGLLKPGTVLAAAWPANAFAAKTIDDALKQLYGTNAVTESKDIEIKAPLQAENGAVVPVAVSTSLPKPEAISLYVKENVQPLAAAIDLPRASGYFSARVKMAKTSEVRAVIKSGGKLYSTSMNIKVTVGGCGG